MARQSSSGRPATDGVIAGAATSDEWYRDVPDVNMAADLPLLLTETTPGSGVVSFEELYEFSPIDGQFFGDEGKPHNQDFTVALHAAVTYRGGETIHGDSWVFID